jgi:hypothetical protein
VIVRAFAATLLAGAALLFGARPGDAQSVPSDSTVIIVHVADSASAPLAGFEVAVLRGLRMTLAPGMTDDSGRAAFTIAHDTGAYEVFSRRLGYARASRFVRTRRGDTVAVTLTMVPVPARLDAVRVTAREDAKRKSYFIDADAIAASNRRLTSALDVILELRPDMIGSRAGWRACPPLTNVWINGRRVITLGIQVDPLLLHRRATGTIAHQRVSGAVLTLLSQIRPEHIEELSYRDCYDRGIGKVGDENAVFIVLKPGIEYIRDIGTELMPEKHESRP